MAIDDELKTKATQLGTEAGGRIFNSLSTEFAPQPFASGGGKLPYDRGVALTPEQELAQPSNMGIPEGGPSPMGPIRPSSWSGGGRISDLMRMNAPEGYPADSEKRFGGGEIGTPYTGDVTEPAKVGIPETPPSPAGAAGGPSEYGFKWTEPETAATRAGDVTARSRIMSEARESGARGMEAARGQDVLDRETSARAKKEGEFNYDKFRETIGGLGGKLRPKLQAQLYEHALTEHGRMQELKEKAREANLIHGEGSPAMIGAKSEARYREIQGQITAAKGPAEVQHLLAESAHLSAQTQKIPYEIALVKEHANYYRSLSDTPEVKMFKTEFDNTLKAYEAALPGSKEQKEFKSRLDSLYNRGRMSSHITEMNTKYGLNLPINPTKGEVYDGPNGRKIKWDGEKFVGA